MTGIPRTATKKASVRQQQLRDLARAAVIAKVETVGDRRCPVCGKRPGRGFYCSTEHLLRRR